MRKIIFAALLFLSALPAFGQTILMPAPSAPFNGAVYNATISSGSSLSAAVDLYSAKLVAVIMPAAWTAAALTFQCSQDNTTFYSIYDDTGTEMNWTVAASTYVLYSAPARWLGCRYIKVRSGTAGTPVNQGADRVLTIVAVP